MTFTPLRASHLRSLLPLIPVADRPNDRFAMLGVAYLPEFRTANGPCRTVAATRMHNMLVPGVRPGRNGLI